MMLLNSPPAPEPGELAAYYRRCAEEGAVFRSRMCQESFGISDSFDPAWSVAAVCWCAGGVEKYRFPDRPGIRLKAGAVLAIGENERYAYAADSDRPFLSSMIIFPAAMTRMLRSDALADENPRSDPAPAVSTRVFRPGRSLLSRMEAVAAACAQGATDEGWYEEQLTLVATGLFAAQRREQARPDCIDAAKPSTRDELARRLRRAVELMHDRYSDPALDLSVLSRTACIARHHFVRVFADAYGVTPLRYLGDLRMEAAARLLESLDNPIAEIAGLVGFTNRSAFQRRFRRHFGVTPARWRHDDSY